ncbi:hypothetical protein [Brevundimonas poindexterae]|uniref:hypothetical protein n=1 Tax=Brevundimonas poindexterae TaxID=74325 RepID=UPI001CFDA19F|nr:hypothetical protein [Brevundimonas poindexterae]
MTAGPNLMLAVTTGTAYALQVLTTSLYGRTDQTLKYVLIALLVPVLFVLMNGWMLKRMGRGAQPLIQPGYPGAAIWASILPLLTLIGAAIPVFVPGYDYGILIVIAGVWFGLTVQSALAARMA